MVVQTLLQTADRFMLRLFTFYYPVTLALASASAAVPDISHAQPFGLLEDITGLEEALHCKTPESLHAMPDSAAFLNRLQQAGVSVNDARRQAFGTVAMIPLDHGWRFHGHAVEAVIVGQNGAEPAGQGSRATGLLLRTASGQSAETAMRRLFLDLKSRGYWFVQERFQPPLQYRLYQRRPGNGVTALMTEKTDGRILFGCFDSEQGDVKE